MPLLGWDTVDYAQIARNVAAGRGLVTSVMPLMGLEWQRQTGRLGHPWDVVHRFPLPIFIEAALIRLFGPNDAAMRLYSGVFFLAAIPLVYFIARRLFSRPVALLAMALFALNGGLVSESLLSGTEPAASFFFLAAVALLLWGNKPAHVALAGLLTGLAYLNRSNAVLTLLPLLYLVWRRERDAAWRGVALFLLPAGIVVAPWLWRNLHVAGDPMFSLTLAEMARFKTPASQGTQAWFLFAYEKPMAFWLHHPLWMARKWVSETARLWKNLPSVGYYSFEGGAVFWLFIAGLLKRYHGEAERLRLWLAAVFALHVLALGLLADDGRYYAIFVPWLLMYGADAAVSIWEAARRRVRRVNVLAAALLVSPLLMEGWQNYLALSPPFRRLVPTVALTGADQKWLTVHTPPNSVIATDTPWEVAWRTDRRSLPLPPSPKDIGRYEAYGVRPNGLYLKNPATLDRAPAGWKDWNLARLAHKNIPGYRFVADVGDGSVYYQRTR